MISKDMYAVLQQIPQYPNTTTLDVLHEALSLDISHLNQLLDEAIKCKYIRVKDRSTLAGLSGVKVFLSESGQIAIEEYARNEIEQDISNESLKVSQAAAKASEESVRIAQESLNIARAAKWAAVASAIAAFATLLCQIPQLIQAIKALIIPVQ